MQYEWQGKTMAIRANAILTSSENHILKNLKKKQQNDKKKNPQLKITPKHQTQDQYYPNQKPFKLLSPVPTGQEGIPKKRT